MARQSRRVLASVVVAIAAILTVEAREFQTQPPRQPTPSPNQESREGRRDQGHERRFWWKDSRDIAEIGLSGEQSATIDAIFKTEIEKMKPMRDSINRMERELSDTVRANTIEVAAFTRQVQKIEKMRAELNTTRTVMLYRMRRVLTNDQHAKLTAMLERREAERRKQDADRRHF